MVEKRSEIARVATWMNFVFQSALKWVTESTAQPSVAVVRTGKSKCLLAQAEPYGNGCQGPLPKTRRSDDPPSLSNLSSDPSQMMKGQAVPTEMKEELLLKLGIPFQQ